MKKHNTLKFQISTESNVTAVGCKSALTCVDEPIDPVKERRWRVRVVGEECEGDGAMQRDAAAWWYRAAVTPPEGRVDQLARLQRRHL